MILDIILKLENGIAKFYINFPKGNYLTTPFYQCSILNINPNILEEKILKNINEINQNYETNYIEHDIILIENVSSDTKSIYDFIRNNKNLKLTFEPKNYKNLVEEFKNENIENLTILIKNSDENIPYKDFCKMYLKLDEIKKIVEHYNFSPLEQVLFVYDIVKSNKYNKESLDENYNISRNLNQIVNNDKIVCVGFANLIDFILTNLGFKTDFIYTKYKDGRDNHIRNYLHLKDEKYNIDGIFVLDATWDSRKNDSYLNNYYYFLKPIRFFYEKDKCEYIYEPNLFEYLKYNKANFVNNMLKIYKNNNDKFLRILQNLLKKCTDKFINIIDFIDKNESEFTSILNDIYMKYNQIIDHTSFKNALYKVRRIEYLNKIIDFEPDEEYIDSICNKYYKMTPEERLLLAIGLGPNLEKDLEEVNADSVEEDLLRIKLLRALKTKLNDFPNNDYIKRM